MQSERPVYGVEAPFPTYVQPMLLHELTSTIPDLPQWYCEIKWEGMRAIVYVKKGEHDFDLTTKSGRRISIGERFPELIAGLSRFSVRHELVLDGELVVGQGTTSEERELVVRRSTLSGKNATRESRIHPATFAAFDLLYLDGWNLQSIPLSQRANILRRIFPHTDSVVLGRKVDGADTLALHALVKWAIENEVEGLVFKRKSSAYTAGKRSHSWLKMKFPKNDVPKAPSAVKQELEEQEFSEEQLRIP